MLNPLTRSGRLAFYGIPLSDGCLFTLMSDFSQLSFKKNPILSKRRAFDSKNEETFISGYSPSFYYSFDFSPSNPVHCDIANITDNELVGQDALRSIIIVDTYRSQNNARKYLCSVIPDVEGHDPDLYVFSGCFSCGGDTVSGDAVISQDGSNAVFVPSAV